MCTQLRQGESRDERLGHEIRVRLCIYKMRYEWDESKNRENQRNHDGISFELAVLVFRG